MGSQGEMRREREGKREMEQTMNGGMQRIFFSASQSSFQGNSINRKSLTSKAAGEQASEPE